MTDTDWLAGSYCNIGKAILAHGGEVADAARAAAGSDDPVQIGEHVAHMLLQESRAARVARGRSAA